jgi:hypothetical protein
MGTRAALQGGAFCYSCTSLRLAELPFPELFILHHVRIRLCICNLVRYPLVSFSSSPDFPIDIRSPIQTWSLVTLSQPVPPAMDLPIEVQEDGPNIPPKKNSTLMEVPEIAPRYAPQTSTLDNVEYRNPHSAYPQPSHLLTSLY